VTLCTAQARVPELSVQSLKISVEKVCEKDCSHTLTVYWQASGGMAPISVGPLSIVYPDGRTQAAVGTFPASGSATLRVDLAGGGKVKVRVQANDSAGRTKTAEQEQSLDSCVQIIGPVNIRPTAYTLRFPRALRPAAHVLQRICGRGHDSHAAKRRPRCEKGVSHPHGPHERESADHRLVPGHHRLKLSGGGDNLAPFLISAARTRAIHHVSLQKF